MLSLISASLVGVMLAATAANAETRSISITKGDETATVRFQTDGPVTPPMIRRMRHERSLCMQQLHSRRKKGSADSDPPHVQIEMLVSCLMRRYAKAGVHLTYMVTAVK